MTLEATLDATTDEGDVSFVFTVENTGEEPVDLRFRDAQQFDIAVTADGTEHYRFSEGRVFAQMFLDETLEAGERYVFEDQWTDPDPGTYEAEATLEATDTDANARATVTVER